MSGNDDNVASTLSSPNSSAASVTPHSSPPSGPSNGKKTSNDDIMKMLQAMSSDTKDTNKTITSFMKKTDKRLDTVESQLQEAKTKLESTVNRVSELENFAKDATTNTELQKQSLLKNNIVVMGIAPFKGENLSTLVSSIASRLLAKDISSDIAAVYRIKGSKTSSIVVKFKTFDTKLSILSAKKENELLVKDVHTNNANADKAILITHHLTPHFARILAKWNRLTQSGL